METLDKFKEFFSILVVDDNDNNRFTLTRRLKKEGYFNYSVAHDGYEALEKVKKEKYHLILLDLMMPGINGIEVLSKLKSDPETESIMVMMISGDDRMENVIDCIKLGAEDFLPKPFNVDILRARVGACMKRRWLIENELEYQKNIEIEKKQYKNLLEAMFPKEIINKLAKNKIVEPQIYENTSIIFIDLANFTEFCSTREPKAIFEMLQSYIKLCETLCIKYKMEKIKTIGDAFMATCGMFGRVEDSVNCILDFAFDLMEEKEKLNFPWKLHMGIDFGPVIAGIVGDQKYQFDVWGDKVNTAARMQEISEDDQILVSKEFYERINDKYKGNLFGSFNLKGKGITEIYEILKNTQKC